MTRAYRPALKLQADPKGVNLCQTLMVMALLSIPFWVWVGCKVIYGAIHLFHAAWVAWRMWR